MCVYQLVETALHPLYYNFVGQSLRQQLDKGNALSLPRRAGAPARMLTE